MVEKKDIKETVKPQEEKTTSEKIEAPKEKVVPSKEETNTETKTDSKETKEDIKPKEKVEVKTSTETKTPGRQSRFIKKEFDINAWVPKTGLGTKVKNGEIKQIEEILNPGLKILEAEIVDALIPNIEKDLLLIGQSKGKFGGGQRRVFKQTQKKTPEGNKPRFATYAVVGNNNGLVGVGYGKSKETIPAREKAFRNAKLGIIKIKRGCGSWQCGCKNPHSIPFEVEGKCGSVIIQLIPAPKGTGLKIEGSCATILKLAGINDIWSKTFGQTKSKINLIKACMAALNKLNSTKIKPQDIEKLGIIEGKIKDSN